MNDAPKGLRLAAPKIGKPVAELTAEDILTGMSAETRVTLAAALAAEAPMPKKDGEDGNDAEPDADPDDNMEGKGKGKPKASAQEPANSAQAERNRLAKVVASEHYAGREALAADLFASDMSADQIISALAKVGKPSAEASDGDSATILAALAKSNPDLGTDGDGAGAGANADHGWKKAHAAVAKQYGRKSRG